MTVREHGVRVAAPPGAAARRARRLAGRATDDWRFGACLAGLAVALAAFLVAPLAPKFLALYRLPTYRDWVFLGRPKGLVLPWFVASTAAYAAAIWLWRRGRRPSWPLLAAGAAVLHLLALLVPAVVSDDVYAYHFYGWAQAHYHQNPYLAFPYQHPLDPHYPLWSWRFTGAVYGPPFLLVLRGVAAAVGGSMLAWVVTMKLLLTAAELAGVWALARALPAGADRRWPVLLVAWNPMVLQAVGMSAHVDAVLLLLVALAVLAHRRARPLLGFVALVGAFLVKLYLGPLAALYAIWLGVRRPPGRRLRTVAGLGVLGAGLTALVYLPYLGAGTRLLGSATYVGGNFTAGSPPNLLRHLLASALAAAGVDRAAAVGLGQTVARDLSVLVIAAAFVLAARRLRPGAEPWPPMAAWFLVYLIATPWVFFWHAVPQLGLVAVIPWGLVSLASIGLSLNLVPIVRGAQAVVSPPPGQLKELLSTLNGTLARYTAPLAVWLAVRFARRRRRTAPLAGPAVASRQASSQASRQAR